MSGIRLMRQEAVDAAAPDRHTAPFLADRVLLAARNDMTGDPDAAVAIAFPLMGRPAQVE
jgi:hypothetical protein